MARTFQELAGDAVLALRRTADASLRDEDFKAWEDASERYLAAVEALPMESDHVGARLQALRVLHGDDLEAIDEWLADEQSGDARLVRQIIMTLIRAG